MLSNSFKWWHNVTWSQCNETGYLRTVANGDKWLAVQRGEEEVYSTAEERYYTCWGSVFALCTDRWWRGCLFKPHFYGMCLFVKTSSETTSLYMTLWPLNLKVQVGCFNSGQRLNAKLTNFSTTFILNNTMTKCWEENCMLTSKWLPGRVTLVVGLVHVASISKTLTSYTAQTDHYHFNR